MQRNVYEGLDVMFGRLLCSDRKFSHEEEKLLRVLRLLETLAAGTLSVSWKISLFRVRLGESQTWRVHLKDSKPIASDVPSNSPLALPSSQHFQLCHSRYKNVLGTHFAQQVLPVSPAMITRRQQCAPGLCRALGDGRANVFLQPYVRRR